MCCSNCVKQKFSFFFSKLFLTIMYGEHKKEKKVYVHFCVNTSLYRKHLPVIKGRCFKILSHLFRNLQRTRENKPEAILLVLFLIA